MLRRNGPVIKSAKSVLRLEGSLCMVGKICERGIGLEPGVKEVGVVDAEIGELTVRRRGRSMNRQVWNIETLKH